jgi:hypothetical protein
VFRRKAECANPSVSEHSDVFRRDTSLRLVAVLPVRLLDAPGLAAVFNSAAGQSTRNFSFENLLAGTLGADPHLAVF